MTIINSIYKGKRYAILLTTILTFYAPVLFAQHIADSALVEVAYGQQPEWRRTSAISSIRGEDLLKTTSASLGNSLQGQLPGLTLLQQSGEPKRLSIMLQTRFPQWTDFQSGLRNRRHIPAFFVRLHRKYVPGGRDSR